MKSFVPPSSQTSYQVQSDIVKEEHRDSTEMVNGNDDEREDSQKENKDKNSLEHKENALTKIKVPTNDEAV